jgi:hypothetical protein
MSRVREDINRYYCFIKKTTKSYVLYRETFTDKKIEIKNPRYIAKQSSNFTSTFNNFTYYSFKEKKSYLITNLWLNWNDRRTCAIEDCDPTRSVKEEVFNTYKELTITKKMAYEFSISKSNQKNLEMWLEFIINS